MPELASTTLPLGTKAPHFRLPDPHGKVVSSDDFIGAPALLVVFLCNHCPYVKHVRAELAKIGREYGPRGVGIVGISSNDVATHPDDSPEKMREEKAAAGYGGTAAVSRATGVARSTIIRGAKDLLAASSATLRVRREGAGRPDAAAQDPAQARGRA